MEPCKLVLQAALLLRSRGCGKIFRLARSCRLIIYYTLLPCRLFTSVHTLPSKSYVVSIVDDRRVGGDDDQRTLSRIWTQQ